MTKEKATIKNVVTTQIRIPESLHEQLKMEAVEMGVALNSHMIELIHLGLKFKESQIFVIPKE